MTIDQVNGQRVREVVYYFSEKPPQEVIDALTKAGVRVEWVPLYNSNLKECERSFL